MKRVEKDNWSGPSATKLRCVLPKEAEPHPLSARTFFAYPVRLHFGNPISILLYLLMYLPVHSFHLGSSHISIHIRTIILHSRDQEHAHDPKCHCSKLSTSKGHEHSDWPHQSPAQGCDVPRALLVSRFCFPQAV